MTVTMLAIRNEFYAQSSPNPSNFGTSNTDLFNLNFYRSKYYYNVSTDSYIQFSSGSISLLNFNGIKSNCACSPSNCVCVCACGDGAADSGDGE